MNRKRLCESGKIMGSTCCICHRAKCQMNSNERFGTKVLNTSIIRLKFLVSSNV